MFFRPAVIGGGGALSQITTAQGSGSSLTIPNTLQAGDFCIIASYISDGNNFNSIPNFAELGSPLLSRKNGFSTKYGVLQAENIGTTYGYLLGGAFLAYWILVGWRPSFSIGNVQGTIIGEQITTGNPSAIPMNLDVISARPLVPFVQYHASGDTLSNESLSPNDFSRINLGGQATLRWNLVNPGGVIADHTADLGQASFSTNAIRAGYFTFGG